MLEFKNLSWQDKNSYTQFFQSSPVHYAEYSFFGLWAWRHAYPIEIATSSQNLCWLRSAGPLPGMFGPVGNWRRDINWDEELANFKSGDVIYDVPGDLREILSSRKDLNFTEERDQHEYIYLVKDLISLKGKAFAHKRNRVRAFESAYEWDYYDMTPENFDEVLEFQQRWRIHRDETMTEDEAASLMDEDIAIQEALKNWNEFNFTGGILKVDEKIIAYTIAEELDEKNLDIRFEKAFGEFAGSYQAINYMFLKDRGTKYDFVNREEDMGEVGLREAKLSYNPVKMLEKYKMEIL